MDEVEAVCWYVLAPDLQPGNYAFIMSTIQVKRSVFARLRCVFPPEIIMRSDMTKISIANQLNLYFFALVHLPRKARGLEFLDCYAHQDVLNNHHNDHIFSFMASRLRT